MVCPALLATAALADDSAVHPRAAWARFRVPETGTAEAIGSYANGCLIGGARLPANGRGYQAVELHRNRHYGHPDAIAFVQRLGRTAARAELGTLMIGDISQPRGGPSWGHGSHQIGLDVDVWFRLDVPELPRRERRNLEHPSMLHPETHRVDPQKWTDAHAELVRMAVTDEGVDRVFLDAAIKRDLCDRAWDDRSWLRRVRPWPNHDDHMHVRLRCPDGSADCESQAPPPPGEGCGPELDALINPPPAPRPPRRAARPPRPPLPDRCQALLGG